MIKEIKVDSLMKKDRNLHWEIDKIKFLYGRNGVGKSTLLDSIYYALTGKMDIFKTNSLEGQKTRPLPYSKLSIEFDDGRKVKITGNESNENISDKVKLVFENMDDEIKKMGFKHFDNDFKQFLSNISYLGNKTDIDEKNINRQEYTEKVLKYFEKTNDPSNQIAFNRAINLINSLFSNIKNQNERKFREDIEKEYDVFYLTVERMAPDLNHGYRGADGIFVKNYKYKLVKTIGDIIAEYKKELNIFLRNINSLNNLSSKRLLEIENGDDNELRNSISLNNEREAIFKVFCNFLNVDWSLIETQNVDSHKILTRMIITSINEADDATVNKIVKMQNFIDDANVFFQTNNKKIIWNDMTLPPKIKDQYNDEISIEDYPYSSGERQIITILFNIHFFNKAKLLILADEIEISLSPDWQEMLYEKIKKSRHVELIGVTHSPFVVSEIDFDEKFEAFDNNEH